MLTFTQGTSCAGPHNRARRLRSYHWLEAADPHHRYGANLCHYYELWKGQSTTQSFFWWLDVGAGSMLDLKECPRHLLDQQQVIYCSKEERRLYQVIVVEGRFRYQCDQTLVHTLYSPSSSAECTSCPSSPSLSSSNSEIVIYHQLKQGGSSFQQQDQELREILEQTDINKKDKDKDNNKHMACKKKWIYVMDCKQRLYVHEKRKGKFHHSSFLSGGATLAAGSLVIKYGQLLKINTDSGHYRHKNKGFLKFINILREQGVNLSQVKIKQRR